MVSATIELQSNLYLRSSPSGETRWCHSVVQTDMMDMMQRKITLVEQLETNSQRIYCIA